MTMSTARGGVGWGKGWGRAPSRVVNNQFEFIRARGWGLALTIYNIRGLFVLFCFFALSLPLTKQTLLSSMFLLFVCLCPSSSSCSCSCPGWHQRGARIARRNWKNCPRRPRQCWSVCVCVCLPRPNWIVSRTQHRVCVCVSYLFLRHSLVVEIVVIVVVVASPHPFPMKQIDSQDLFLFFNL